MEYYEPLTPELRQGINETIEKELGKLNTCKPTFCVFVVMIETLIAWNICRDFIKRIRRSRKHGNERQGNKR